MKKSLSVLLGVLALAGAAGAGPLLDFSGATRSIDEYLGQGKWRIVMFWASDCHVCNQEANQYVAFHEKHAARDAAVLGISLDGPAGKAKAQAFIDRHDIRFENLIIDLESGARLFTKLTGQAWVGTPTFLIYGPNGTLLAQQVGAVPVDLIEKFMADNGAGVSR